MKIDRLKILFIIIGSIIIFSSCSTTKKLGSDETLYTGVKKMEFIPIDTIKINSETKALVKGALNVKPNNPLYSPYYRTPFPIGLWVYNNWEITPKSSGIKKWIYNQLVATPVLISTVRPAVRMEMVKNILNNNGYFDSYANYQILNSKSNAKKARLNYTIRTGKPYTLSSIKLINGQRKIELLIDSLAEKNKYLVKGTVYNVDSLNQVRIDIANNLRNDGYYYFSPEYITYQADTTIVKGEVALKMLLTPNIPKGALIKYYIGKVTTYIYRNQGGGVPDTIYTDRSTIVQWKPSNLRKNLIPSCITFRQGKRFRVKDMSRTQSYLTRLGIFKSINMSVTPMDSLGRNDTLNVNINCTFDAPIETSIEFNGTYKSNDYFGPGLVLGLSQHNLFGGGEQLTLNTNIAYEWQMGKKGTNDFNSNYYELGIGATLSFPRLLAPRFVDRSRRELNWTRIKLNGNIYNLPGFIKYFQIKSEFGYQWNSNTQWSQQFIPLQIVFSKILNYDKLLENLESLTDQEFSSVLTRKQEFIPQMQYIATFNRTYNHNRNSIQWQTSVSEAGNIFSGIWKLGGKKSEESDRKELFGVSFAQYLKGQTQFVYGWEFMPRQYLVSRFVIGAAAVYGNSTYLPIGEDFYSGGPNSLRGFPVRGVGPGGFSDTDSLVTMLNMRGGSFKLEMNVEYRFPIWGVLNGAVFVDAGNVWLLKDPADIYINGLLSGKTFFKDIAVNTGLGLRVVMDIIVLRADLGIGLHAPYDTGKSGYFNMRPVNKNLTLNFAIGYPF